MRNRAQVRFLSLAVLAAVLSVSVLSACGGAKKTTTATTSRPPTTTTTTTRPTTTPPTTTRPTTTPPTTTTPAATLKSIGLTPASSANLTVGATLQFKGTGTYSDNSSADITSKVTWTSSNTTAVSVSAAGLATGLAAGSANITASLSGVTSPAITLTVLPP